MYPRGVVRRFWSSRSLTARIVALTALLLSLGLSLSATVMIGLLQRHLIAQVDDQLSSTVLSLAPKAIENPQELAQEPNLPTLYYLNIQRANEEDVTLLSASTRDHAGKPLIPELLKPGQSAQTATGWTDPVTVESTKKGSTWRVIIVPITRSGDITPTGRLTVALPLNDVKFTIQNMAGYVATTAIAIIAIGTGLPSPARASSSARNRDDCWEDRRWRPHPACSIRSAFNGSRFAFELIELHAEPAGAVIRSARRI